MKIAFFTPIAFQSSIDYSLSIKESLLNIVEKYFILGKAEGYEVNVEQTSDGKIKHNISNERQTIQDSSCSKVLTALKIVSYMTLVIPAVMLLAKVILRAACHVDDIVEQQQLMQDKEFAISKEKEVLSHPEDSLVKPKKLQEMCARWSGGIIGSSDQMEVPSKEHPWVYSKMPKRLEKPSDAIEIDALDEEAVTSSLIKLCDALSQGEKTDNIDPLGASESRAFFKMEGCPGIKFSSAREDFYTPICKKAKGVVRDNGNEIIRNHYEKTMEIKQLVEKEGSLYSHLCVPNIKLLGVPFGLGARLFIAEERMADYRTHDASLVWKNKDRELREAFKELAALIDETGLCKVDPSGFTPVCSSEDNSWSLVLTGPAYRSISPKTANQPQQGILELIKHLYSEESLSTVFQEIVAKHPEQKTELQKIVEKRSLELAIMYHYEKIQIDYGIDPYGPLSVIPTDNAFLNELGIDLSGEIDLGNEGEISKQEAVKLFIGHLNNLITNPRGWVATVDKHRITYNPLDMGANISQKLALISSEGTIEADPNRLWVREILNALVRKEIIYSWNVNVYSSQDQWDVPLNLWIR